MRDDDAELRVTSGCDDLDAPVYRVFQLHWFDELLRNRVLALPRASRWGDPFLDRVAETATVVDRPRRGAAREATAHDLFDRCHGSCWTTSAKESDASWRVYAPHRDGVRVRSSVGALLRAFRRGVEPMRRSDWRAGRVEYLDDEEIVRFVADAGADDVAVEGLSPRSFARLLFVKPLPFAHESEFRLVCCDVERKFAPDGLVRIALDPSEVVEEILLDPRLPDFELVRVRERLAEAGWSGPTPRSSLYDSPPIRFSAGGRGAGAGRES